MHGEYKTLLVAREAPVLTVQLNIPEAGNAISGQVLDDLLDLLGHAEADPDTRVMVLAGAGDDFCAGGDRAEFSSLLTEDPSGEALGTLLNRAQRVCDALRETELVTIARLHGDAIGAGLGLAVLCDLRVGADNCRFRMPELGLGVPPAWGGILPRLLREAGQAPARELLLTCENFDAATAKQLSILNRVVPLAGLDSAVKDWCRPLGRRSPAALRLTKKMLNAYANSSQLAVGSSLDAAVLTAALATRQLTRLS
ncbi:enoyl-CoA hydratase/isomerase family protein [Streptomyces sp. NPDC016566]|uniref:enoyl-CoA hydratase/isomerase family protein n=1 Tax=Streptomyces sp. NPDC016566 TaxID=3364967 RepID=UPI0036FD2106